MATKEFTGADLKRVQALHAALGYPIFADEVCADLADLSGVSASMIRTMYRYGFLIGETVPPFLASAS